MTSRVAVWKQLYSNHRLVKMRRGKWFAINTNGKESKTIVKVLFIYKNIILGKFPPFSSSGGKGVRKFLTCWFFVTSIELYQNVSHDHLYSLNLDSVYLLLEF
jgi:hypothetical protein